MSSVLDIEKRVDFSLDTQIFLQEIVSCLEYQDTAQVMLEMYGLSIMEDSLDYYHSKDTERFIKLFVKTGLLVLEQLIEHKCYQDNQLQLVYSKHFMDNVVFIDKKSMMGLLREEYSALKTPMGLGWSRPFVCA